MLCKIRQGIKAFVIASKTLIQGDRCGRNPLYTESKVLVIGNGPSLNDIDLSMVPSSVSLACVNAFAIYYEDFFKLKPRYYVIIDPVFFLTEDAVVDNNIREQNRKLMAILQKVTWEMVLVIPQGCKVNIENKFIICEKINNKVLNDVKSNKLYNFLYRRNLAICGFQNVLVGALYYFILKGVPRIYIAGADMNEFMLYRVDFNNHVIVSNEHFYEIKEVDCTQTGKIPQGEFCVWMGYYSKMLKEFRVIKDFADYQGVSIINFSLDSYIDVFEKKEWKAFIYEE